MAAMSSADSSLMPLGRRWSAVGAICIGYGVAYFALHALAGFWGEGAVYSLWFPIAGVRFALLWRLGARMAPGLALSELGVQGLMGAFALAPLPALNAAAGVALPVLAYGVGVHISQRIAHRVTSLNVAPLPLGLALVITPIFAATASLPWALLDQRSAQLASIVAALAQVVVFCVGDLLGVLMLAPPVLWAIALASGEKPRRPERLTVARLIEAGGLLIFAALVAWVVWRAGLGVRLEPVLLATIWIGLRLGCFAAWLSSFMVCCAILVFTRGGLGLDARLELHMLATAIAVCGFLAGSYSDAERALLADIARRDRLLYQADRLKTLRAMSLAVIHEVSQPLSLLAIEARHMRALTQAPRIDPEELRETASLIERKLESVTDLVRRLRGFGGRTQGGHERLDSGILVKDALEIVAAEAKARRVEIRQAADERVTIDGNGVELRQALVNLLLNAIAAAPAGLVVVAARSTRDGLRIEVETHAAGPSAPSGGMGIGLIVARAIVEAHGGRIDEDSSDRRGGIHTIILPRSVRADVDAA